MDKKITTSVKDIRKKMRKLSLAEKNKVIKEQKQKEKQKMDKQRTKVSQRVKVNINIPHSLTQPTSYFNPNQFQNREQTTLLKSINEQLKQKNEPTLPNRMFNQMETQTDEPNMFNIPIVKQVEKPIQISREVKNPLIIKEDNTPRLSLMEQIIKSGENKKQKSNEDIKSMEEKIKENKSQKTDYSKVMDDLSKGIKEKAKPKSVEEIKNMEDILTANKPEVLNNSPIKEELISKVKQKEESKLMGKEDVRFPIVNKPVDDSNLGLLERVSKNVESEVPEQGESLFEEMTRKINEKKDNEKEKKRKEEIKKKNEELKREEKERIDKLREEQLKQIEEQKLMKKQDKSIRRGRKPTSEEEKEQKKKNITLRGFNVLLQNTPIEQHNNLRDALNNGFLDDKGIKNKLKNLKFSKEEINNIFKNI